LPRNSNQAEKSFMALQNCSHSSSGVFFRPSKSSALIRYVKTMFKQQFRSMDGYSHSAIMNGLHLINSIRGFQPLNWTCQRFHRNPLYSKRMINRIATHVK